MSNTFLGGPAAGSGPQRLEGFIGAVVADEPRAVLAAREVLALGGTAGDAATTLGFALSVTLPSRAGLGGGGACVAYNPDRNAPGGGVPEAIMFLPAAPPAGASGGDRPAALPMMARGLFALHSRYGRRPFENAVAPAEQLARLGFAPSRALLQDLRAVSGPLIADPNSRNVFAPGGRLLVEGGQLLQPDLGGTLARLRTAGVGDLYQGNMARQLEAASRTAGGPLLAADLRGALPRVAAPLLARAARDQVAFLPLPADGGLAADAAFGALQSGNAGNAGAIALGAASRARAGGSDAAAILASPAAGSLPPLPASTSFAVMDREGSAVACAVTMGNLFGTGRTVPGMGMLLAASPATTPPPLLASAIVWNPNTHGFRAAVGASGQNGAALAAATALANALATGQPMSQPVPDPGRANVITCSRYHDSEDSCAWATDPRGNGLAVGAN